MDAFAYRDPVRATLRALSGEVPATTMPSETPTTTTTTAPTTPTTPTRGRATARSTSTPQTPNRRSPRVEALKNAPPTPRQLQRMEMEDVFKRRVAPRLDKATVARSTGRLHAERRTRADTATLRAKNAESAEEDSADEEANPSEADQEEEGHDEGDQDEEDHDEEEQYEEEEGEADDAEEDADVDEDAEEAADDEADTGGVESVTSGTVQVVAERVTVPVPLPVHRDWAAWLEYVKDYSDETYQVLVVKETMNAGNHNNRIKAQKDPEAPLPLTLSPYERVYICTHGWKKRQRGTGKRPARFIRHTRCPFRFRVQWTPKKSDGVTQWYLCVKPSIMWHNHLVGADIYATYPIARKIKSAETAERADEMVADGLRRAAVYDMLLAKGENVYQVDVDNLYRSHHSRISLADDNEALAREVALFTASNDGGVVTVDQTNRGETGVISITTQHMRAMFARFGELLLVDCTHKTNRYNYQLCTFMVMDEFGHGKVVQQSLLETNADWHMQRAILHLKRANAEAWKLVRVIVVDKDLNEIRVLQSGFPEARVLICLFHVLKYLSKVASEPRFGKISTDDHKTLDMLIHRMVYAQTKSEFENEKLAFVLTCDRLGFMSFVDYMDKNWFNCTAMWTMCERSKLPHFKNHTNNRLENYFGKFKQGVDENSSLTQCLQALIGSARRSENEYEKSTKRQGSFVNENYDEEMSSVLLCSTPFVAAEIEPQYTSAMNKFEQYAYQEKTADNFVIVKGQHRDHVVNLLDWSCDCDFATSMRLPCRHAMAYRRMKGGRAVIPLTRIDIRWKRQPNPLPAVKRFTLNKAREKAEEQPTPAESDAKSRDRYNEALRVMQPICSELADIADDSEFQMYVEFLQTQYRNIRQRKRAHVVPEHEAADSGAVSPPVGDEDEMKSVEEDEEDETMVGDETMEGAPIDLSQANSLFSSQVGDVPAPTLPGFRFVDPIEQLNPRPGQDVADPGHDMDVGNAGKDAEGDEQGGAATGGEHSEGEVDKLQFNINQMAPKTGRKAKDVNSEASSQRQERARFNASEKVRRQYGELTLLEVIDALDTEKPDLEETKKRLAGVTIKFGDHASSRPKYQKLANPTLNKDAYYLLPPTLLDGCVKKFPMATGNAQPIRVGTPDLAGANRRSPRPAAGASSGPELVAIVAIAKVGLFSRQQIETMRRVETLKDTCTEGERFAAWLGVEVAGSVPASLQSEAKALAVQFKSRYPFASIPGLQQASGFTISMFYRVRPRSWFSDANILAFCERLVQVYAHVRTAGLHQAKKGNQRGGKGQRFDDGEVAKMAALASEDGVKIIMVPVNFGDWHWTCIYIDVPGKKINFYDSMNKGVCIKPLENLAVFLSEQPAFADFDAVGINSPIQQDGFSCGLFVCFKFWSTIDKTISKDMSNYGLETRRLEYIHFVLHGFKIN